MGLWLHTPYPLPVYLPLDSGKLDPPGPWERAGAFLGLLESLLLSGYRRPDTHMTPWIFAVFAYFHQPITPKESHSWRIRSSVWVTVPATEPTRRRKRKWADSEITHLSQVCCVRLGHWDACNPCGDQASLQLRGGAIPRMAQSLDRGVLPAQGGRRGWVGQTVRGRCSTASHPQENQLFVFPWRRHPLGAGPPPAHPSQYASSCPEKMEKVKCSFWVS